MQRNLDIFGGQTAQAVLVQDLMKELHITPVYIPEGCTGYVQLLDTILNKLLKDRIAADLDEVPEERADEEDSRQYWYATNCNHSCSSMSLGVATSGEKREHSQVL